MLDTEGEQEVATILQPTNHHLRVNQHESESKLSFSAPSNIETTPYGRHERSMSIKDVPRGHYVDSYQVLNAPIENEWMES